MRWNNFTYLVKQGVASVWYNRMMSFASFCVLMVSLLLVGLAALVSLNANVILKHIENRNEINIYTENDLPQDKITAISDILRNSEYSSANGVRFYSKEEAWEDWKQQDSDYGKLYEYMDYNPMPDTFIVTINDLSKISAAVTEFQKIDGVEKVSAQNDIAELLVSIRATLTVIGGAVILALIVVCLVIIYNSSRSSVFSRRTEINIMKYVGATNYFVKIPFFIEGMFIGVMAGVAAWLLTKLSYEAIISIFDRDVAIWQALGLANLIAFDDIIVLVLVADCLAGAVLSAAGIIMSMGKHLRV